MTVDKLQCLFSLAAQSLVEAGKRGSQSDMFMIPFTFYCHAFLNTVWGLLPVYLLCDLVAC